jgi:hypothetical protein
MRNRIGQYFREHRFRLYVKENKCFILGEIVFLLFIAAILVFNARHLGKMSKIFEDGGKDLDSYGPII